MLWAALSIFALAMAYQVTAGYRTPARSPSAPFDPYAVDLEIERLQFRLQKYPDDADAYARLGLAHLQLARETGDVTSYATAERAFGEALKRNAGQVDALVGEGLLALARHDFIAALEWGELARNLSPYRAQPLGILVDAYVELGRYEEAVAALEAMVDLRPDLASFSRISYMRELHGDINGAILAMEKAVRTGVPGHEATLWAQVHLGQLHFKSGDLPRAEAAFRLALFHNPAYPHALAGLGLIKAAHGDHQGAIDIFAPLASRLPYPEYIITLGELYEATGNVELAEQQYQLLRVIQKLNASAGIDIDLEMALFEADHGTDPSGALRRAQVAYLRRPGIYAADVLAWALYQDGDLESAWRHSQEALRLGTLDALLYYHAGVIAHARGEDAEAYRLLKRAISLNPAFSIRHAPRAKAILAEITRDGPHHLPGQ